MVEDEKPLTKEFASDNPENPKIKKKRPGKRKSSDVKSKRGKELAADMADNDYAEEDDTSDPEEKPKAAAPRKRRKSSNLTTPKPKIKEMVEEAIGMTQQPNGVSLQIIKKFLAENFHLDIVKNSNFIRNAIKRGVATGEFIQVKGVGASGSFKLGQEYDSKPPKKTKRQQDSEVARKKKDAKSVLEAKRIARKAHVRKIQREEARSQTRHKVKGAKPAKGTKKLGRAKKSKSSK